MTSHPSRPAARSPPVLNLHLALCGAGPPRETGPQNLRNGRMVHTMKQEPGTTAPIDPRDILTPQELAERLDCGVS
jgi:hypothetical protein